jgi:crotonobetainyl-CoA:carnitine CoA-transferase CaiB-like acyl-CoA transferase
MLLAAPEAGKHIAEILKARGYGGEEIGGLRKKGVIR